MSFRLGIVIEAAAEQLSGSVLLRSAAAKAHKRTSRPKRAARAPDLAIARPTSSASNPMSDRQASLVEQQIK